MRVYTLGGLLALQAIGLALIAVLTYPSVARWHSLDLSVYANASFRILHGQVPYRDFSLEYPPLAIVPFTLPRLVTGYTAEDLNYYHWLFLIESVVLSTLIAFVVARISALVMMPRERVPALLVYSLLVAILAPLAPWRYDLFPALFTVLALLSVLRARSLSAGVWLGLGIAAKLYPVVLVPVFGLYYLFHRQYRALVYLAIGVIATLLLTAGVCAWFAPGIWLSFLQYHEQRGLQIESVAGGLFCLAGVLGWVNAGMKFNFGAVHFTDPTVTAVVNWLQFVFGAAYLAMLGLFAYRLRSRSTMTLQEQNSLLINVVVAALLVFIVTNKVFSPQYILWILPFIPLLAPKKIILFVLICILTILIFPFFYPNLVSLEQTAVVILNMRNALMLLIIPLLFYVSPAEKRRLRRFAAMTHADAQRQ